MAKEKLLSCIEAMQNVLGDTIRETVLRKAVLKNNYNVQKALNAVLPDRSQRNKMLGKCKSKHKEVKCKSKHKELQIQEEKSSNISNITEIEKYNQSIYQPYVILTDIKQKSISPTPDSDGAAESDKNGKRIISEEEAKAALAEKRKLASEQAEREAELERQRQEELKRLEEERLQQEEEDQRKFKEEQLRLIEEHRRQEEEKFREAIEDQEQQEEEERVKRDEEMRLFKSQDNTSSIEIEEIPKKIKFIPVVTLDEEGEKETHDPLPASKNLTGEINLKSQDKTSSTVIKKIGKRIKLIPVVTLDDEGEEEIQDSLPASKYQTGGKNGISSSERVFAESWKIPSTEYLSAFEKRITKWTVEEVIKYIQEKLGTSEYSETFRDQDIDGQALLMLKESHLRDSMSMKLGPALKLLSNINNIKEELNLP